MHPQGVDSHTFSPGPLDGSLTVPQLLERHLKRSPEHLAYIYDDPQGNIVSIKYSQYIRTVHAAARLFLRDSGALPRSPDGEATVIGIFATTGMMVAAFMRVGLVPFCISPRNAPAGLANLLKKTKTAAVYVSDDLRGVLSEGLAIHGSLLPVLDAPTFEGLQRDLETSSELVLPPIEKVAMSSTAMIIHSSGSTSIFSKPVYMPHKLILQYAAVPWSSTMDHCGQILGSHTLPNFHAIGILLQTWPISSGLVVAVLRPTTPQIVPTPDNSLKGTIATKPDIVLSTPACIETWSQDSVALEVMQSLKSLAYIGASLHKRVGDALVAQGVALCSIYATMETGLLTPFFKSHGKDWDYIYILEEFNPVRVPEEDGSGLYTLTYLVSPEFATAFTNTEIDGKPGCSVSDLLEQHPENPDLHRIFGRKDDLIAFSSGAKMNPVPFEAHVNRNPFVDAALVFGQGKPHPGIIIQVKPGFRDDLECDEERSNIYDSLCMHPQGTNSPTFSAGPVDGALTIPQLLELQLKQSPDHPAYIYDDPQGEIISINFSQYIRTVHAAARLFLRDTDTFASRPDDEATVIAIFATADTISYCMMVAAVMRAGMVPFCVSPRNSPASLGNLLKQTSSAAVYVSDDLRGVLSEGLAIHGSPLPVFNAPTFIGFQCDLEASFDLSILETGLLLLQYATAPWTSDKDHCGQVFGSHILPNFHGIGVFLQTWPFTSGLVVAVHRPTTPPILPNPETALKAMMTIKPDLVMATPAYIETWSEDPNGLKTMQSLKYLSYVGATLNKRVGDDLVAKGVVLCSTYGAMEVGLVAPFFKSHGKDWDYISVLKERNAVRVVEDDGSGLYTHTYLVSPTFATAYTNTQIDGKPGCSVSDLLEQHPENPDLHRVYGRKDDLIAFSTAAKMNPVPVEAQVNRNPFVDAALVFGQGKPHPGMIIQLKLQFQDDLQHDEKRSKISDSLW
ncbi:hypothetical protein B0H11DRAFT_2225418 [Mycena galericulata]|nr:hypothetical protein B0H11DRAFT_2225418 [Mycena galericulata]